jgi:hypothetical protein
MLMLAPWSVVGAIKLAAAKDIGNSPSRHCDASSKDIHWKSLVFSVRAMFRAR